MDGNLVRIWQKASLEELQKNRNFLLELGRNDTKGLSFLQQNQLIFAFQRNILKNKKNKKYVRWFDFAKKSMNKRNQKVDFVPKLRDEKDDIFKKIIQLLKKEDMNPIELNLAEEIEKEVAIEVEAMRYEIEKEVAIEKEALRHEYERELEEAVQEAVLEAVQKTTQKKEKEAEEEKKEIINQFIHEKKIGISKMLKADIPIDAIAEFSNLSIEEVKKYIVEIKVEKSTKK